MVAHVTPKEVVLDSSSRPNEEGGSCRPKGKHRACRPGGAVFGSSVAEATRLAKPTTPFAPEGPALVATETMPLDNRHTQLAIARLVEPLTGPACAASQWWHSADGESTIEPTRYPTSLNHQ